MMSDVPVGAFLSGGLDSSAIVYEMSKYNDNLETFSVGFGDGEPNELKYAKIISDEIGTNHNEIKVDNEKVVGSIDRIIYHMDEPKGDPGFVPNFFLSEESKKKVTVALSGEGADEILGGYTKFKILKYRKFFPKSKYLYQKFAWKDKINCRLFASIFSPKSLDSYAQMTQFTNTNNTNLIGEIKSNPQTLRDFQYIDIKTRLVDSFLMKADKMSMSHALEVRVPFLDHNLVSHCYNLKDSLKINLNKEKYELRKYLDSRFKYNLTKSYKSSK